jgi:modification methylase
MSEWSALCRNTFLLPEKNIHRLPDTVKDAMETTHQILFQNSDSLKNIAPNSIDLVATSPPYPMIEMWDDIFARQDETIGIHLKNNQGPEAFERMHKILDAVWKNLFRVLKPGSLCCINIGDATRTLNDVFQLWQNHSRIVRAMLAAGFLSLPCILWRKQTNAPNKFMGSGMLAPGAYVTLEHEYILIFRKGDKREFITEKEKQNRRESAYFWEERNNWFSDVWMDLKGASQTLFSKTARNRSAAFPFELPYRLINMFSVKGDTVLDPFLGIGTTMAAAMASARNSIGVEISPDFKNDISSMIPGVVETANQRIRRRITDHLAFVETRKQQGKAFKHENKHYRFPVVTNQEKEIIFNALRRVKSKKTNAFEVAYADDPAEASNMYWGELFRNS